MQTSRLSRKLPVISTEEMEQIILSADSLPAIPVVAARVLTLLRGEDVSIDDLARTVLADPSMAAKVVKMANAPFYGWRRNIRTIPEAITILGFNTLKGLVLAASLSRVYEPFGPTEKMLWKHAGGVGIAARFLAFNTRRALMEEAFLVGLLHDVGKQVLNAFAPEKFAQAQLLHNTQKVTFAEAEQQIFSFTHGDIGGCIVERWNFPAEVVAPVRYHHRFNELVGEDDVFARLTEESFPIFLAAVVGLADKFCLKLGIGCHMAHQPDLTESREARYLGIDPGVLPSLLETFQNLYAGEWAGLMGES